MPAPANLVHQTATSTGTGNISLTPVNGKQSFSTAFSTGSGNTFDYFISNRDQSEWERGVGYMDTTSDLVRSQVVETSIGTTAAIDFTAGTKDITNDIPADEQVRSLHALILPRGRLTLTTATPVLTSSATAQTTIYYTPYVGNVVPIYDGAKFVPTTFTELSLALDSNAAHTGYHQSGMNFDLFVINDSGTIRLASGPAWTNDTTRAESVSRLNGILVSDASIVLRYGSGVSDTVTYTNRATYVGTFRASANGQTQVKFGSAGTGSQAGSVNLWNYYNRVPLKTFVADSTASWSYASGTFRQVRASAGNQISVIVGKNEDAISARSYATVTGSTNQPFAPGIGVDASTVNSSVAGHGGFTQPTGSFPSYTVGGAVEYNGYISTGWHTIYNLESGGTGVTFYGSGRGPQTGMSLEWLY